MPNPKKQSEELAIVTSAYDIALELTRRVRKFPRDLRFVLGDRILNTAYDLLDVLLEAKYVHDKAGLLSRANGLLDRLRYQMRLCVDEKLISLRQYEYLAVKFDETGRMAGGWKRSRKEP